MIRILVVAALAALGVAGCGTAHINGARTGPLHTPAAAPISATARLEGSCALGGENWVPLKGEYGAFTVLTKTRNGVAPQPAYQVTLTNTSSVTARLGSWVIVYENSAGHEITSANGGPSAEPTYILPNQTLTFTESVPDIAPPPAGAYSCQFLAWG